MGNNLPIGVFDSGVGGLTVVKQLQKLLPNEEIIYFGDTKRNPYGPRSDAEIITYIYEILEFLASHRVKAAVAACNTITVLLNNVEKDFPFKIIGMSKGVRSALALTKNKSIGVIATEATIRSGKHLEEFVSFDKNVKLFPTACPKFAPYVEAEQFDGLLVEQAAREYLTPISESDVDVVVLACTHYPLLSPVISRVLGSVELLDPAYETALDVKDYLQSTDQLKEKGSGYSHLYFSADVDKAERIASRLIDVKECRFSIFDLEQHINEENV